MEDSSTKGNFLFVAFDEGSFPDEYRAKMDYWSMQLGYDVKTGNPRGVLLVNLVEHENEAS